MLGSGRGGGGGGGGLWGEGGFSALIHVIIQRQTTVRKQHGNEIAWSHGQLAQLHHVPFIKRECVWLFSTLGLYFRYGYCAFCTGSI